jgi:DNA-binding MarR family transcriptional regulator
MLLLKGEMIMTHDEQVEQAHALFQHLIQVMLGRMAAVWADQGLSLPQIRLLFVLAHFGPLTVNQIAERLRSSQPAASLLVDRLVQAHLAERTEDLADRRRALVRLAEEGEVFLGRQRTGQQRLHLYLNELGDTHLTIVIDTLTAILTIADTDGFFEKPSHDSSS